MGRWNIWRSRINIRFTRERVRSWQPNNSTITRSLGNTSVIEIKLMTITIVTIILFQFRVIGIQSIGLTDVMPTSCHWQRSIKITYGGTWSTDLIWSLSWVLGASWDGIWLKTHLIMRQRLGDVDERWLIARRGTLSYHDLVTAPKYCGKWLVDENKWRRVKQTYQKQIRNNWSGYCKMFTRRHWRCTKGLLLCAECYATHVLDADT